jgi:phage terminase small subunit
MKKEKALLDDVYKDCPVLKSLPFRYQKFIVEYIKDFNGQRAAITARFSKKTARSKASQLLTKVNIQQALAEVTAIMLRSDIADAQELREFWTLIMRGNIADICSWNEKDGIAWTASSEEMDRSTSKLIKKLKTTTRTSSKGDWTEVETSFELHDPLKASELLARDLNMLKDRVEHSGPDGGPIEGKIVVEFVRCPGE